MKKTSRVPSRIVWAVEQLAVRTDDRLFEIGCGSGYAVRLVCEQLVRGTIAAIDRSAIQVSRARVKNKACLSSGRTRIEQLALNDALGVFGRSRFTKVFAINVNAFWTEPDSAFDTVRRLLRRDGELFLFYEPPTDGAIRGIVELMRELFARHGFSLAMRPSEPAQGRLVGFVGRSV